MCMCVGVEGSWNQSLQILRDDGRFGEIKSYANFLLLGVVPLIPVLFKGQLYIEVYIRCVCI